MYKENRIGPHMLFDPTDAYFLPSLTTGVLGTHVQVSPVVVSATVPNEYNTLHVNIGSLVVANNKSLAIGIPINGVHFATLKNMYTIVGQASVDCDVGPHLSFGFGVSNASTVTVATATEQNTMTKFIELPSKVSGIGIDSILHVSCKETLLSGGFRTDGTEVTNPHLAYFRVMSHGGGTVTIASLQLSISLHKHLGSIDTHDPARS